MSITAGLPSALVGLLLMMLAQEVVSGPELGKDLPALPIFAATGPQEGKDVDYAGARAGKPTVYVFITADRWDRPMARFLKGLDAAVPEVGADAVVVAVWLTGDANKTKEYLPRAQQSLQLQATYLSCFTCEGKDPPGWHINADAHITVVVGARSKVAAILGYRSINEQDVAAVRQVLKRAWTAD